MQNNDIPEWAWDVYQACQEKALKAPNGTEDEKLNYLLRLFKKGKIPKTREELDGLFDNHLAGHRQKLRRRISLLEKSVTPSGRCETHERLAFRDSLETIWRAVTVEHFRLLNAIADGHRYGELSGWYGIPAGTLKSTVSRVRNGLRAILTD